MKNMQYKRYLMTQSPHFPGLKGNRSRGTRWWRLILDRKWKCGRFVHTQWKICNISVIIGTVQ